MVLVPVLVVVERVVSVVDVVVMVVLVVKVVEVVVTVLMVGMVGVGVLRTHFPHKNGHITRALSLEQCAACTLNESSASSEPSHGTSG
jgi:hypothetical protein